MPKAPAALPGLAPNQERPLSGRVTQSEMRAANLSLLLRQVHAFGGQSRAQLAAATGLSKATTSSLIADLVERGLVREGQLMRDGAVGRPGTSVTLDGSRVTGLGLEIGIGYLTLTAVTLDGQVLRESAFPVDTTHLEVDAVLERVASHLEQTLSSLRDAGVHVVGITVSPPGVIDYRADTVRFAPNLGWYGVPVVSELKRLLGENTPAISLENDAKLAALSEYNRYARRGVRDLLYLSGQVGIGAGIITGGRLMRGWQGASGEVGHMPLDPNLAPCACGRRGCWETIVGLNAFLELATSEHENLRDPARPIGDRMRAIRTLADAGDATVLSAIATIADRLGVGIGILVDVLNPRVVVLGGYFAHLGKLLLQPLEETLEASRMTEGQTELATSRLGLMSAARGGALLALEAVLDDPSEISASA